MTTTNIMSQNNSSNIFKFEYFLNTSSKKWIPYKSTGTFDSILQLGANTVWCDYHSRPEKFIKQENGIIQFECGRHIFLPMVQQNTKEITSILFTVDIKNLNLDVSFRSCSPRLSHARKIVDKTSTISHFNLKNGVTKIEHIKKDEIIFNDDLDLEKVPEEIQIAIQNTLSQLTNRVYGVPCKNSYKLCQNGFKYFVKFPSCPPIAKLPFYIQKRVNRNSLHIFEDLCSSFDIKPAKSFRKKFLDNPEIFLVNLFLKELDFTDANLYNDYYENAVFIDFLRKNMIIYSNNKHQQTLKLVDNPNIIPAMKKWIFEAKATNMKEQVIARRLIEPIFENDDINDIIDGMSMYLTDFNRLPGPLKKRILKEGFNTIIHNRICEALNIHSMGWGKKAEKNLEIKYTEKELSLEYKLEQTTQKDKKELLLFELPKTTDDLSLISEKMHNCVGFLYVDKVVNKNCLIITVENHTTHKGVACIEIRLNTVVQALGPCNKRIEKKYIQSIRLWMKLHHLGCTVNDLSEERKLD